MTTHWIHTLPASAWLLAGIMAFSLFWLCYPFVVFPVILRLAGKWLQQSLRKKWFVTEVEHPRAQSVAVVFCAFNEEAVITAKLENLVSCAKRAPVPTKIRVYFDGCTDRSAEIAKGFWPDVEILVSDDRRGKSHGMRKLVDRCSEDLVIFTDANVLFADDLIANTVALFADDPALGCVAGSTAFINQKGSSNARVEGGYWKLEEHLKVLESSAGSCLCGTGAIFAIRRELFVPPPDDIIDDFHTTLNVLFQRRRVIQSDRLLVYERAATKTKDEWKRKVRITCRAYNCYRYLRCSILRMPAFLIFVFFSHKWIRWYSAVPFTLLTLSLLGLIAVFSPWMALLMTAGCFLAALLGLRGVRPFGEALGVARAFYGTFFGVILSFRGERFVTWTPVASTRSPMVDTVSKVQDISGKAD